MMLNHIALMILAVIGFGGKERVAQFTEGNLFYSNWDDPHVTLDSCLDRSVEHLIIPSGVTHNGRFYPIIEIGKDALRGMHNLVDVTIEMRLKTDNEEVEEAKHSILRGAFKDCPRLCVIKVNDTIPPSIGRHPFYGAEVTEVFEPYHLESTIIVVPPGREEDYRNAQGWREFKYIQSSWPTPEEYHLDSLDVRINELEIELQRARGTAQRLQQELDALRQSRDIKSSFIRTAPQSSH